MRKGETVISGENELKISESTLSNKARIKSENALAKNFGFGSFSLNKTVIVNSNQHLQKQGSLVAKKPNQGSSDFKHHVGFQIN